MSRLAWVTGAGGLIGSHLMRAAPTDWQIRGLTRAELDLNDFAAVRAAFHRDQPQMVFHCAALSSVAACDANPQMAWQINVEATQYLAGLATNISLLFLSTDLVFDGHKGNYQEGDAVNPLMLYAETKAAAEQLVLANPKHIVIRTSLTGGSSPRGNRSFDEQLRLAWQHGKTTHLFVDEFRSPIPAPVTARAIWELVANNSVGLFHLGGAERISRFALGQLVAARWPEPQPSLEAMFLRDFAGPPRPADTSLDNGKIQQLLSFPLPRISDWLRKDPAL